MTNSLRRTIGLILAFSTTFLLVGSLAPGNAQAFQTKSATTATGTNTIVTRKQG